LIRGCPLQAPAVEKQQRRAVECAADSPMVSTELIDVALVELVSRAS
jgi:hypothetical protein